MNELVQALEACSFAGRQLVQLCFSENTITFHFDEHVGVAVEWAVSLRDASGRDFIEKAFSEDQSFRESRLVGLVGLTVVAAVVDSSKGLVLTFAGGAQLTFVKGPYPESYRVRKGANAWTG